MVDDPKGLGKEGLLSFPAYRSAEWLQKHRLMPAVDKCLNGVTIQPKSIIQYLHIRAYALKVGSVSLEIRNALFRQALFKVQNIEVASRSNCKNDRILLDIVKLGTPSYLPKYLQRKPTLSKELWLIDRCGESQSYKVVYYHEGEDGYYCKVYPRSIANLLNFLRYYMSL